MRAGELLRELDRRLLPPLAQGLTRLGNGPVRLRVLTGAALVSSAAVLVTAVWAADRPGGDLTAGEVTRVGVVEGESIPGYVQSSRTELASMVGAPPGSGEETYALVALSAYLAPDRLAPVLSGVSVSEVFGRVPLPDTQTQIVRIPALRLPEDVVATMAEVAERKDREAHDFEARSAALTGDDDEARRLRLVYDSGARVALAEATAYRSQCSCVYAAVVRATPSALQRVAGRPEVRAVDPAPEVSRLERAVFSPPLPEQEDIARAPADNSLPPLDEDDPPRHSSGPPPGTHSSPGPPVAPHPSGSSSGTPAPSPSGPATDSTGDTPGDEPPSTEESPPSIQDTPMPLQGSPGEQAPAESPPPENP